MGLTGWKETGWQVEPMLPGLPDADPALADIEQAALASFLNWAFRHEARPGGKYLLGDTARSEARPIALPTDI